MVPVFDIGSANDLFELAEHRFNTYCGASVKTVEDVILVTMIVNHLREWIAPDYNLDKGSWPPADTPEKKFSREVYDEPNFDVVRKLCNGTKHQSSKTPPTKSEPLELTGSHPDVKVVITGDIASAYYVDGRPFEQVVGPLMDKYRSWFGKQAQSGSVGAGPKR